MWGVADDFGGKISEDGMKMRFRTMLEYSIEQITQAGTWILKNRKTTFPAVPTTKEFIDAINIGSKQIDTKALAGLQCDIVLKYLNAHGSQCDHIFKHPTTRYLMENRWSFEILGNMDPKEFSWFPKNFIDAFIELNEVYENHGLLEHGPANRIPADELRRLLK